MALFRFHAPEPEVVVHGQGILLRRPRSDDHEPWALLREQSREFLEPWEPIWPSDDLSRSAYRRRLKRYEDEIRADHAYPFLIFAKGSNELVGGLTIGMVRRGAAQTCTLGYWIGAPHARKGYMTSAVPAALGYAFGTLNLHRVDAAVIPENDASLRVLEKAGFRREGFAPDYLCIAGRWRDHVLLAILAWEHASRHSLVRQSSVDGAVRSPVQAAHGLPTAARTDTTNLR